MSEKKEKSLGYVNDGTGGLLDSLFLLQTIEHDLNNGKEVVAFSIDSQPFGSKDVVVQFACCSDGSVYKRVVTLNGVKTKFICTNKKEDSSNA